MVCVYLASEYPPPLLPPPPPPSPPPRLVRREEDDDLVAPEEEEEGAMRWSMKTVAPSRPGTWANRDPFHET